jgi:CRP/FNR family transcriptional regulator, cyclic AMP receptor protein
MKTLGDSGVDILNFLGSAPVFSRISVSSALVLAEASRFQQVEKGEIIFIQSDPSEAAYIVRTGNISIVLNSADGREMIISEMHSGDVFGELGVLTKKPRSTSAVAQCRSQILVIPKRAFLKVMDEDPYLARLILELTANRLQMSVQRESALAFMDAQARLARLLLELDEQEQKKGYITISQEELANRTGLIRQTVAKALGKWRRAGWLITGRGHILILDRKSLKKMENNLVV